MFNDAFLLKAGVDENVMRMPLHADTSQSRRQMAGSNMATYLQT
jgi:hypothetical protein